MYMYYMVVLYCTQPHPSCHHYRSPQAAAGVCFWCHVQSVIQAKYAVQVIGGFRYWCVL